MILYPGSPRSYFVGSSDLLRKEVLNRTSAIVFHSRSEVLKRTSARGLFDGPSLLVLACLRTIGIVQFQTCISHQIKWTPSFICCLLIASVSKSPEKYLGGPLRHKTTSTGKQNPSAKREQSWALAWHPTHFCAQFLYESEWVDVFSRLLTSRVVIKLWTKVSQDPISPLLGFLGFLGVETPAPSMVSRTSAG